ncbi:MAG: hypothetical protein M1302_01160 [Candidatus Thermoplasmatota archaeon]|nr:hypothetical protein [Candidatus Thermoplasmatota archaeon]
MTARFDDCFSHIEENEESAAECIHCLKKHGEQVMYDPVQKRLILGREIYDDSYAKAMQTLTDLLRITSLEDYQAMDRKYNLTMY